jgi:hypothetical protein
MHILRRVTPDHYERLETVQCSQEQHYFLRMRTLTHSAYTRTTD